MFVILEKDRETETIVVHSVYEAESTARDVYEGLLRLGDENFAYRLDRPVHPKSVVEFIATDNNKPVLRHACEINWRETHPNAVVAFRVAKAYQEPLEVFINQYEYTLTANNATAWKTREMADRNIAVGRIRVLRFIQDMDYEG